MGSYKIAELRVNMECEGKILEKQASIYISNKSDISDIAIGLTSEFIKKKQSENLHLAIDECEYIWKGSVFYYKLLNFSGFMLHASAVALDNEAYLFSAKSGTGKSTHTKLWQNYFGENRTAIINDDKPVIRYVNNKFYVYGTPWSGTSDKNLNIKVPLKGIIFIEQSRENWIKKISNKEAIKLILGQTVRPKQVEKMDQLLLVIDKVLKTAPIYKMGCNISEEAVKLVYSTLNENK